MRDVPVRPILFIGCIGPAFLCLFICGMIYLVRSQPQLTWPQAAELKSAIEHYEQVRAAVFRLEEEPSALNQIAVGFHLEELQNRPTGEGDRYLAIEPANFDPVIVSSLREYESDCSVVILDHYHDRLEVAVELRKIDSVWKVERITPDYNAGIAGVLPLKVCV